MSRYEQYEDELVTLLQMPGVNVMPLPREDILELPRQTQVPEIFVLANGTNFDEREELAVVAQPGTVQCQLFIRSKTRRGESGIFSVYEKAANRLLGYRMQGARTPIYFNSFNYVMGLHNNWAYALSFSFGTYHIESDETDEAPLIKQITHEFTEL